MTEPQYNTQLSQFLPTGGAEPTMSSREIADLCGKEHRNVMRDTRKLLVELHGEGGLLKFEHTYADAQNGQSYPEYLLPKRECLILVSGYKVGLRAKIIDRWMELEKAAPKSGFIDFSDPKLLLGVVSHLQAQVGEQALQLVEQGTRLKKLDRIEGSRGAICITDAAKTLGVNRDDLIKFMQSRRWIYKRVGNKSWIGFQDKLQAGYIEHDEHPYFDGDGHERIATRALVTGKGLVKLAELLEQKPH